MIPEDSLIQENISKYTFRLNSKNGNNISISPIEVYFNEDHSRAVIRFNSDSDVYKLYSNKFNNIFPISFWLWKKKCIRKDEIFNVNYVLNNGESISMSGNRVKK